MTDGLPAVTTNVQISKPLQAYYDKLFQDGFLVNLHVRIWGMGVSLSEEDLDIKEKLPNIFKLGKKMLIKPEVLNQFKNLEGKARRFLYKSSFPFPIADAHFVPKRKLGEVILELDKYREEFRMLCEEFYHHYDDHKQEVLTDHAQYATILEPLYPTLAAVKEKFGFSISMFELAMPKNMEQIDIHELIERDKVTEEVKAQIQAEMRTQYESSMKQLEEFGTEAAAALRSQVTEACSVLINKIENKEVITKANLNTVREMIDQFHGLNFMDDQVVADELDRLRNVLDGGSNFKTDTHAIDVLNRALTSVVEQAKDLQDVRYLGGEYFRPLKV